jgi:hypothetical protein
MPVKTEGNSGGMGTGTKIVIGCAIVVGGSAALVVALVVCVMVFTPTMPPAVSGDVTPGTDVSLWASGAPNVMLGADDASYDEAVECLSQGDTAGVAELLLKRRAFLVPKNTHALFKDIAGIMSGHIRVRITSGEQIGRIGFVHRKFAHVKDTDK